MKFKLMYFFFFKKLIEIATQHLGLHQWPAQKERIIQFYNQLQVSVECHVSNLLPCLNRCDQGKIKL